VGLQYKTVWAAVSTVKKQRKARALEELQGAIRQAVEFIA